MVYQIGIPSSFTYLTEEAAYRVLDILPRAMVSHEITISGSGCSKVLGRDEETKLEFGEPEHIVCNPHLISMKELPSGYLVTYRLPDYPAVLRADRRITSGPEARNLWLWQQVIQEKRKTQ